MSEYDGKPPPRLCRGCQKPVPGERLICDECHLTRPAKEVNALLGVAPGGHGVGYGEAALDTVSRTWLDDVEKLLEQDGVLSITVRADVMRQLIAEVKRARLAARGN